MNRPGMSIRAALIYITVMIGLLVVAFTAFVGDWHWLAWPALFTALGVAAWVAWTPVYNDDEMREQQRRHGVGRYAAVGALMFMPMCDGGGTYCDEACQYVKKIAALNATINSLYSTQAQINQAMYEKYVYCYDAWIEQCN